MNVLYVTMSDLLGQRFNGHQLHTRMGAAGWQSEMLVIHKSSADATIHGHPGWVGHAEFGLFVAERVSSLQGLLSPIGFTFPMRRCFQRAQLVHWNLVSPHYISLPLLPWLSRLRPTVWTLHDPLALTGHCIHPMECERWRTGCGCCPDLSRNLTVWFDTTRMVWKAKRAAYRRAGLTLVVPSRWMKSMVDASPLLSSFPCHVISPGLDLELWRPRDKGACRDRLGIPRDAKVVAFRMPRGRRQKVAKGIPWLIEALHHLDVRQPTVLLTFEEPGQLGSLAGKYTIAEFDWVNDEAWMAEAMAAADIFIQPSLAETAPTMALEAMACGTPAIACNTTAMPEILRAPRAGMVVPPRDAPALAAAIDRMLADDGLRAAMGAAGREIIEGEHTLDQHVARHVALYESVLQTSQRSS